MGLRLRFMLTFVGTAGGTVLLFACLLVMETREHLRHFTVSMDNDLIRAVMESAVMSSMGAVLFSMVIGLITARYLIRPLTQMKRVAEKMADGNWTARVKVTGTDELAHLGRALNYLTEELEKQEQLRKNLTEDVAHDLRTPLTTLKSHLEALIDGIWEPNQERLQTCYEEIERLTELVQDLEQLSELESPNFLLQYEWIDVVQLVRQRLIGMEPIFLQKEIDIFLESTEPVYAYVDENRLKQVITNLLSNSWKYTHAQGKVNLAVIRQGDQVKITVSDTGIGIPKDQIPLVFTRFYRVDKSRSRERGGSGIGLAIVQRIIDAHRGNIQIESKLNVGTKVTVWLPIHTPKRPS